MEHGITKIGLFLTDWTRHENGATAIEYSLVAAAIALGIMGIVFGLGDKIYDVMYSGLPEAFDQ